MSKRKNQTKRMKAKLEKAAKKIIGHLTLEEQERLATILAKAVAEDATDNDSLRR